jgi:hypothetical protein
LKLSNISIARKPFIRRLTWQSHNEILTLL